MLKQILTINVLSKEDLRKVERIIDKHITTKNHARIVWVEWDSEKGIFNVQIRVYPWERLMITKELTKEFKGETLYR